MDIHGMVTGSWLAMVKNKFFMGIFMQEVLLDRKNTRLIHRHPLMFTPPPSYSGDLLARHHRFNNSKISQEISSSSKGGRWDRMVLKAKSLTGIPHSAVFQGMWSGWGITIRTKDQMICGNTALFWTKTYTETLQINVPPPI